MEEDEERAPREWAGTTRDKFAAEALNGLCAIMGVNPDSAPIVAAAAYLVADHMVQMRQYTRKELKEYLDKKIQEAKQQQLQETQK